MFKRCKIAVSAPITKGWSVLFELSGNVYKKFSVPSDLIVLSEWFLDTIDKACFRKCSANLISSSLDNHFQFMYTPAVG